MNPVTPTINELFPKICKYLLKICIKCAKIPNYCVILIYMPTLGKNKLPNILFMC